ncbi:MAG: acyl-CoA dehydrogenase family protein [Blastomonas sp.]
MDDAILDPFGNLLADLSSEPVIRNAEIAGDASLLWSALEESGFLDALVCENKGGVGLAPAIVAPLAIKCGEHLVPAPVAETMVARAVLAQFDVEGDFRSPIILWPQTGSGELRSQVNPVYCRDAMALTQTGSRLALVRVCAGERDGFNLLPARVDPDQQALATFEADDIDLMAWAGAIHAAYMAGAMNGILAMSIEHVNSRAQFGRPLAKFQVIQHNLAIMAELVASANIAAHFGLSAATLAINPWRVAVAKCHINESAGRTCTLAHAAHGAIGISQEHKLQLFTRRVKRWQMSFGSEGYWSQMVAAPWRVPNEGTSIDIIRGQTGEYQNG